MSKQITKPVLLSINTNLDNLKKGDRRQVPPSLKTDENGDIIEKFSQINLNEAPNTLTGKRKNITREEEIEVKKAKEDQKEKSS